MKPCPIHCNAPLVSAIVTVIALAVVAAWVLSA